MPARAPTAMAMTVLFIALMLPGLALLLFIVGRFAWRGGEVKRPGRGGPDEP